MNGGVQIRQPLGYVDILHVATFFSEVRFVVQLQSTPNIQMMMTSNEKRSGVFVYLRGDIC